MTILWKNFSNLNYLVFIRDIPIYKIFLKWVIRIFMINQKHQSMKWSKNLFMNESIRCTVKYSLFSIFTIFSRTYLLPLSILANYYLIFNKSICFLKGRNRCVFCAGSFLCKKTNFKMAKELSKYWAFLR